MVKGYSHQSVLWNKNVYLHCSFLPTRCSYGNMLEAKPILASIHILVYTTDAIVLGQHNKVDLCNDVFSTKVKNKMAISHEKEYDLL